jgi:hypothetical protein
MERHKIELARWRRKGEQGPAPLLHESVAALEQERSDRHAYDVEEQRLKEERKLRWRINVRERAQDRYERKLEAWQKRKADNDAEWDAYDTQFEAWKARRDAERARRLEALKNAPMEAQKNAPTKAAPPPAAPQAGKPSALDASRGVFRGVRDDVRDAGGSDLDVAVSDPMLGTITVDGNAKTDLLVQEALNKPPMDFKGAKIEVDGVGAQDASKVVGKLRSRIIGLRQFIKCLEV